MKRFTAAVVFVMMVFIGGRSWGQNLVGNGSFEDTIECPNGPNEIQYSAGWSSYRITPDYFNSCANGYNYGLGGVPDNAWGSQEAYNGNAYAALGTYNTTQPNSREFIGRELSQLLTIGTKYFVSAYVSRCDNINQAGATNNFGFTFFLVQYSYGNPAPINNFSHVHCDSIIFNKNGWTRVAGSFIADQAYQYIAIGNFYDDAHTDTADIFLDAAYYVDEVCVSTDSLFCLVPTGIIKEQVNSRLTISPNPVQNLLTINFLSPSALASGETIAVYDVAGRKIVLPTTFINNKAELTITTLPNGIYLLQIINNITGVSEVGKFVKE